MAINKEMHIKAEEDESPVLYTLKEIGNDFLVWELSQRVMLII